MIIQLGLDELDDIALVQVGRRMMKVPCWLAAEWNREGGIYEIVREYRLEYLCPFQAHDYRAFDRMRVQARAMRRFYLHGNFPGLSREEQRALYLEIDTRQNYPHLRGDAFYEHITQSMGTEYGLNQVKAMLRDISDMLASSEAALEEDYYERLAWRIEKMNAQVAVAELIAA